MSRARRSTTGVAAAIAVILIAAAGVLGAVRATGGSVVQLPGAAGCLASDVRPTCGKVSGLDASTAVAVSLDGRSVYVAGLASLAVLSRDGKTGALQQPSGVAGCLQDPGPSWHVHGRCRPVAGFWPTQAVVTPDGRNVYVASAVDDRAHGGPFSSLVQVFDRDAGTGLLQEAAGECAGASDSRHCSSARALRGPSSLVVSPDGRNVYVGSDGGISIFRRTANGALVQLPGPSGCVLAAKTQSCSPRPPHTGGTAALAVSADGKNVYALVSETPISDANPNLLLSFRRNIGTGALTELPGSVGCLAAAGLATCRLATGLNGLAWELSIALSPDGKNLYVGSGDGVASFARRSDGHLDQLPGTGACLSAADWATACTRHSAVQPYTGIVASPDGKNVYFALGLAPGGGPGSVIGFVRNAQTGALSFSGCAAESRHGCTSARGLGQVADLAISPDGRTVYAVGLHGNYPSSARILVFRRG